MRSMKYLSGLAILLLTLSLSALAKDNNSGKFNLDDTAQIGSTQLAPGQYKAEWSGPADNVKISIVKDGKVVATTEGKVENLQHRSPYDATSVKTLDNNTKVVNEIQFNNRSQALVLSQGM